jgi:hypothetical protein
MASLSRAAEAHDLLLVTTYVPVLTLCARATALVLAVHWLVHGLESPAHVVAAATAAAAYADALAARGPSGALSAGSAAPAPSAIDAACGFLAPVAFALVAQPTRASCGPDPPDPPAAATGPSGALAAAAPPGALAAAPAPAAHAAFRWLADFLWSFAATFDIAAGASGLRVPAPPALKLVTAVAFALVHVVLACAPLQALEMALRAVLFYTQCAVCILCARFTNHQHHAAHAHAALHLLFVHSYAAVAGFLIVLGVHVRFILRARCAAPDDPERPAAHASAAAHTPYAAHAAHAHAAHAHAAHARPERRPRPELRPAPAEAARAAPDRDDYADLVRKLQAAKAASGML